MLQPCLAAPAPLGNDFWQVTSAATPACLSTAAVSEAALANRQRFQHHQQSWPMPWGSHSCLSIAVSWRREQQFFLYCFCNETATGGFWHVLSFILPGGSRASWTPACCYHRVPSGTMALKLLASCTPGGKRPEARGLSVRPQGNLSVLPIKEERWTVTPPHRTTVPGAEGGGVGCAHTSGAAAGALAWGEGG